MPHRGDDAVNSSFSAAWAPGQRCGWRCIGAVTTGEQAGWKMKPSRVKDESLELRRLGAWGRRACQPRRAHQVE